MICDLLARAGISARVDGEFLAGAGGELPLGNAVKVRVDPARAAEARAVIDEWERTQPPEPTPAPQASRYRSPLWFLAGAMAGAALMFAALRGPSSESGVDYDGDENYEIRYHFAGRTTSMTEMDRNGDGKVDAVWHFDVRGVEKDYAYDDDFDGRFEWIGTPRHGQPDVNRLDADGDGRTDVTSYHVHGVERTTDFHRAEDGRVVKRVHLAGGMPISADFDADGDGTFERHVEYDRLGEPK